MTYEEDIRELNIGDIIHVKTEEHKEYPLACVIIEQNDEIIIADEIPRAYKVKDNQLIGKVKDKSYTIENVDHKQTPSNPKQFVKETKEYMEWYDEQD